MQWTSLPYGYEKEQMSAKLEVVDDSKERNALIAEYFDIDVGSKEIEDESDVFGIDFTDFSTKQIAEMVEKKVAFKAVEPPKVVAVEKPLRIDIGCGVNKRKDGEWVGVDSIAFDGVDVVCNLVERCPMSEQEKEMYRSGKLTGEPAYSSSVLKRWPWDDNSVDEANCSHFLEHLTNLNDKWERVHFFNELYRVLKVGAKCTLVIPHWASNRYYGDPTHKEPFSEMGFYYLGREWRLGDKEKGLAANAPHADKSNNPNGYDCNFSFTCGYGMNPAIISRNIEYQQFALQNYKEAATDLIATLVKA